MGEGDLARLLLEHRDGLFAFVLALVRDRGVAEEIFQEVGVAILKEETNGAEVADFLKWGRGVARHRVQEYFRTRAREGRQVRGVLMRASLGDVVEEAFDEAWGTSEEWTRRLEVLRGCVEELPKRAREMVHRRYQSGESLEGIARGMGWRIESVKVALSRARRALAECVERKQGVER